jgi:hypothetical protein
VALVGFRYGSTVPGEAVSYTELEFTAASGAGLPRLVFLQEDVPGRASRLADADRSLVQGFRKRLRDAGLIVRDFSTASGLELEVFHALSELANGASLAPGDDEPGRGTFARLRRLRAQVRLRLREMGGRLP